MDLSAWHDRLEAHFSRLRALRPAGRPIFALEHGLSNEEVSDLQVQIRKHILHQSPSNAHNLAWIVYATEFGYLYFGDEYWQTFEEQTLGWTHHGDRRWIREAFKGFVARFGGAQPTGAWAEHFSIICWPITHAILPRDLQRQFAKLLYDLRGTLRPEFFDSPQLLGTHISNHSYRATARFRYFAQEPLLVGQIALALLLRKDEFTDRLILHSTLQRITADLDRERHAREWLKGAQRSAEQERLRGLRAVGPPRPHIGEVTQARERIVSLGLEPRIVLRASGADSWQMLLHIPELSPLLDQFPEFRSVLTESRCHIAGSDGRPLARGRLLFGDQQVLLKRLPEEDEVLLGFEKSTPALDALLRVSTMLIPGPIWLFRHAKDGFAYSVLSKIVRSGQSYLILSRQDSLPGLLAASQQKIECAGVYAWRIDTPPILDRQMEQMLKELGLSQVRTVHVWPVGLPPAGWDGEGDSEWLTLDRPRVGIKVDHAFEAISLRLDVDPPQRLEIAPGGSDTVFVELPQLPKGLYTLNVRVRTSSALEDSLTGYLLLRIRDLRPWTQYGLSDRSPIRLSIDPPTPNLEELWGGDVTLELRGPKGIRVSCEITLFGNDPHEALIQKKLPLFQLPFSSSAWKGYFEKFFQDDASIQNHIDAAKTCEIRFAAGELGQLSVRCEREFTPVRWIVKRVGAEEYVLELRDDSGLDRPAKIILYAFSAPTEAAIQDFSSSKVMFKVPEIGGLFLAEQGSHRQAVILPPKVRRLQDLRVTPEIPRAARDLDSLIHVVDLFALWSGARCAGNIASFTRRHDVLEAFQREIVLIGAGKAWSEAEARLGNSLPGRLADFVPLIPERPLERDFAIALGREFAQMARTSVRDRTERLAQLARTHIHRPWFRPRVLQVSKSTEGLRLLTESTQDPPENAEWLVEYSLRLMSAPGGLRSWAGGWFVGGLQRLRDMRVLIRGARFLVLAVHSYQGPLSVTARNLYSGWDW